MAKPRITAEITLGSLITSVSVIGSVFGAFYAMKSELMVVKHDVTTVTTTVKEMERKVNVMYYSQGFGDQKKGTQ